MTVSRAGMALWYASLSICCLSLSLSLVQGQSGLFSASTVYGVFTDASCTQPYQNGSFTFADSPNDGSCLLSNSGSAAAGFTNIHAFCSDNSILAYYYNTSAPPTSNVSNNGICPNQYIQYRLSIYAYTPLNNTQSPACNSARLTGLGNYTTVYTTAVCLTYNSPTSGSAVTSTGHMWRVQVLMAIVSVAMMLWW